MSADDAPSLIAADLAGRLDELLGELRVTPCAADEAARLAQAHGIAFVDARRTTFFIDARVYEGALVRSGQNRQRAERLAGYVEGRQPIVGVWRRLSEEARR